MLLSELFFLPQDPGMEHQSGTVGIVSATLPSTGTGKTELTCRGQCPWAALGVA